MVKKLIIFLAMLVVLSLALSFTVSAVPNISVSGVDSTEDYANANGNYTYVGTNDNGHNWWRKIESGDHDYVVYYYTGETQWVLVFEGDDSTAMAEGDSPQLQANYYVRDVAYVLGAEGNYATGEGPPMFGDVATVENITVAEGGDPPSAGVPEFSDYAIMLLLVLAVGGFVVMRNQDAD
ncbi:hypothetical protein HOK51_02735 [Candidatus Woesearchaeota archaeon]|jgi:hypothetical protein|nr:hypothetical protein [Candidatus Woesearchaeota archaeon]MBT6518734.1 hypothetical protein [Candidatus Woesearchaeota archaeon]MBT7367905.1 hypothetical protein [Candidatus Woesearchaeota archaeon]